jgi:hypothetical protein
LRSTQESKPRRYLTDCSRGSLRENRGLKRLGEARKKTTPGLFPQITQSPIT